MPRINWSQGFKELEFWDAVKWGSWIKACIESEAYVLDKLQFELVSDRDLLEKSLFYLEHDYFTDIITFDYSKKTRVSGEIWISRDRVLENAILNKVSVQLEFMRVCVHGVLHLCGYKDKSEEEQEEMRRKENEKIKLGSTWFHVEHL